jgi:MATE family multidrug resistance protein
MKFGLPSGVQLFVDVANFTLFVQLVGRLGSLPLAATNLAFNLNTLAFIPLMGIGTAVMTLTGQRIGEGRPRLAVRTTWLAFCLSTAYMILFALVYLLLPHLILAPYKLRSNPADFPVIEEHVVHLLRFVAVYSLFDAMNIIFSSTTRGAGDTRFALVFSLLTGFLVMVVPTWWGMRLGYQSLSVPWFAVTACVIVLGIGFFWRFMQGKWMTMRVIEHTRHLEE